MMKHEFENLINGVVQEDDWEIIHTVYQWHPAICEVDGKRQIADLYLSLGMSVIKDMLPRAEKIERLTQQLNILKHKAKELEDEIYEASH